MSTTSNNPLLRAWSIVYGLPQFDTLLVEHFDDAMDHSEQAYLQQLDSIASEPTPPTFANTVEAFDRAGRQWKDISLLVYNLSYVDGKPAFQAIEAALSARIAGFQSRVCQHQGVFSRLHEIYLRRGRLGLPPEQLRLLERIHLDFEKAGALLEVGAKARVGQINERLAELYARFTHNVQTDESNSYLILDTDAAQGLPETLLDEASALAMQLKLPEGQYAISVYLRMFEPFMSQCPNRELRRQLWALRESRGRRGNEFDNRAIITEIMVLRSELAQINGFASFADFEMRDTMAKTPETVLGFIEKIWPPCVAALERDRQQLTETAIAMGEDLPIEAWDWLYLNECQRRDQIGLVAVPDLKPYFSLDAMLAACFACAGKLFGLDFQRIENVTLYDADAIIWQVSSTDGELVGHMITDLLARPSKQPFGWMHHFRYQHGTVTPTVVISCSFTPDAPTLLSLVDARALFHEFGHGLHGLLSRVKYERLSGTQVCRDWAEFPSQLFEHWLDDPAMLASYARHYQTGEAIPPKWLQLADEQDRSNRPWGLLQLLARAWIDIKLHAAMRQADFDPDAFEVAMRQQLGMPNDAGPHWYLANFIHLFSAGGYYAAAYYVYLWGELLEADAFGAFEEHADFYETGVAAALLDNVFAKGNAIDPAEAFYAFRGRPLHEKYFLHKYQLTAE